MIYFAQWEFLPADSFVIWSHHIILEHLLTFGMIGFSWLFLYIPSLSSIISHFSRDLQFLIVENGIRNQDLGTGVLSAPGMPLLPGLLSRQSWK